MRRYLQKFWQLLGQALQQGVTPRKLAVTCALGVVLAVFPVYGATTLLCFIAAFTLRLNMLVIQAVNYLLTPLQVILIIPFMQGGIHLFKLRPLTISLDELMIRFQNNFWEMLQEFGQIVLGAVVIWLLVAIPAFLLFFYATRLALAWWQPHLQNPVDVINKKA